MEGAGEDPYLGFLIAKGKGNRFPGKGLGNTDAVCNGLRQAFCRLWRRRGRP